jgi:hypothetical protein
MKSEFQLKRLVESVAKAGALRDGVARQNERLAIDLPYPRLFARFLKEHLFIEFKLGDVSIGSNLRDEAFTLEDVLADKPLTDALLQAGFVPFGRPSSGSYDRICFDIRPAVGRWDAPVVRLEHEAILVRGKIPKPAPIASSLFALATASPPDADLAIDRPTR